MLRVSLAVPTLLFPAAVAAFSVDSAAVRVNPARTDQVRLAGRLQGVDVEGASTIRLALDGVGFTLDLAAFTRRGRRLRYQSQDDAPGIRSLALDLKRKRYRVALSGLALDVGNVVAVELRAGESSGCASVPLIDRKRGRRSPDAQASDPTRPRRLILASARKDSRTCLLSAPVTDPTQLLVGDPGEVRVQVRVDGVAAPGSATVSAADATARPTGAPLCTLADDGDGALGDDVAGDGVLSCVIALSTATPLRTALVAQASIEGKTVTSPPGEIRVVGEPTDDDLATVTRVQARALAEWEAARAEHGDTLTARLVTMAALRIEPGVASVRLAEEQGSITIEYTSGIIGGLTLELREDPPGLPSAAASALATALAPAPAAEIPEDAVVVGNRRVFIWDTGYFAPWGATEAARVREQVAASTCPRFDLTYFYGSEATLDRLSEMTGFGTVVLPLCQRGCDGEAGESNPRPKRNSPAP